MVDCFFVGPPLLDTMDLLISWKAEEGPLSLPGGRDFPSVLSFHQSQEAIKEATVLEVNVIFCDVLQVNGFVFLVVRAVILYRTRGARGNSVVGIQGLENKKLNNNISVPIVLFLIKTIKLQSQVPHAESL